MKIPFFEQDLKKFLSSKTNYISMASILFGGWGTFTGKIPFNSAMYYIEGGLLGLGLKDAIVKY